MQEIRLCDCNDAFQFQEHAHLPVINVINVEIRTAET